MVMEIFYPGQMIKGAFVTCAFQVFLPQLRPDYPLGVYYFVFFFKEKRLLLLQPDCLHQLHLCFSCLSLSYEIL